MNDRNARRVGSAPALRFGIASVLFAGGLAACNQAYRPVSATTLDSGNQREYRKLLVVTRDGYQLELVHAFIRPDSVVGFTPDKDKRRVAFAHDNIARIESSEWSRKGERPPPTPSAGPDEETTRVLACVFTLGALCPRRTATPPESVSNPPKPAKPETPTAH